MRPETRVPVIVLVEGIGALRRKQRQTLRGLFDRRPRFHLLDTASGADALALMDVVDPDLVILAEQMPDMKAAEFCRQVRQLRKASIVPLIVLGVDPGVAAETELLAAGADEYLRLPVHAALLHARAIAQLRRKHAADEREDVESILFAMAQAVERRDATTGEHCQRLAELSVRLGRRVGLDREDLAALHRGGYLHDIGKVAVPDSILFKNGPLTMDEWEAMKQHTIRGEAICRPLRTLAPVLPIIRSHHERWDGTGYPDGIAGEEIPLLARILQVVDIYDALTSIRPYKAAMTHHQAVEALRHEARIGWRDPDLVQIFAGMFPVSVGAASSWQSAVAS